ncbi:carbon storage regulator [Pirellulaceae bacterium SH467]
MLVLSRKEGERIVIGENITLVISRISGNRVAIGIEAPKDVAVVRGELKESDFAVEGVATNPMSTNPMSTKPLSTKPLQGKPASLREFAAAVLPLQRQVG